MTDGIGKAIGSQLGELGKQIVSDVVKVPGQLTGMDSGTNETKIKGTGGKKSKTSQQVRPITKTATENIDPLLKLKQKEEVERQRKLDSIRQELSQQFSRPTEPNAGSVREQIELEEMEKKRKEIEEEKEKAKKVLNQPSSKRKKGMFGIAAKVFGGEKGKNVVSQ